MSDCREALRARGICVIIPTYNNAGTVADVVSRSLEQCSDVFVVCDGCTDGTASILRSLSVPPVIIELPRNRGKGYALKQGFLAARKAGFSSAITLDADGQHYPEDIPLFLQASRDHPGALIVGSRKFASDAQRSASSRFANSFSNFWFFVQTLRRLPDTQTGYRLYPLCRLHGLRLLTSRYESELELLVGAAWHGVPTVSIEVNVFYPDPEHRVSHFRPGRDFARISVLNTILCVLALVYALPLMILRRCADILRTVIPIGIFAISTILILTPCAFVIISIKGRNAGTRALLNRIFCSTNRFALWGLGLFGIKYTLSNPNNEDFSKPAVIICNHQSHLDLIPMMALTPKLVIVTADYVWKSPIYGYVIRNAGYLKASEGNDRLAEDVRSLAAEGYSIAIYPEGTRSIGTKPGRFHQGAFYLADKLGMDILPCILYGTGLAMPKHSRIIRRWPIKMQIEERIHPGSGLTPREQATEMRRHYRDRYTGIADSIERTLWTKRGL